MKKYNYQECLDKGYFDKVKDYLKNMPELSYFESDHCGGTYGKYYDFEYGLTERMTQEEFDHLINTVIETIERVLGAKVSSKEIDNDSSYGTYFIEFEDHACVLDCEIFYEEIDNEDDDYEEIPEAFQFGRIEFGYWIKYDD